MEWDVEFTDEFAAWWDALDAEEQDSVNYTGKAFARTRPESQAASRGYAGGFQLPNMRKLRIQHEGRPYRVLYAFDPRRGAILLLGGDKTGNPRWYKEHIPKADELYRRYLRELETS